MLKIVIPLVLTAIGTGSGIAAAIFLEPATGEPHHTTAEPVEASHFDVENLNGGEPTAGNKFVAINNQFFVPVVNDEKVTSLVLATLTLEVTPGSEASVHSLEPKLRGVLLQTMFDHANLGGFNGNFTGSVQMDVLRQDLLRSGRTILGESLKSVLVVEIARQDT